MYNVEKEIIMNNMSRFYDCIIRKEKELERMKDLYYYIAEKNWKNITLEKYKCYMGYLNHSNLSVNEIIKKCDEKDEIS